MSKKIKILRILNRFNLGGPIYNVAYLSKFMNAKKYENLLIGGKIEKHEKSGKFILENLNIPYYEIKSMRRPINLFLDFISLIQVVVIMYKFKPDIIHTHAAKAGIIGRIASILFYKKINVVHTYHGNVFEGYFSNFFNELILNIERVLSKFTDKVIAISQSQKNDLVNIHKLCDSSKIVVIPLGFDLKKYSLNKTLKRVQKRKDLLLKDGDILITTIGRVVPIKNHKLFVDVIKYCKKRTKKTIKALVIGDGSEMLNLINYTSHQGLKFSYKDFKSDFDIFFCSWKKDIDNYLAASDIVALTSINEGTPVSIIEAMASGTPSISTDVGGVSDIIENGVSGVVSKTNIKDFGNDLLILIENENIRIKLAKKGIKRSLELYHYDVLIKNIEKLYNQF